MIHGYVLHLLWIQILGIDLKVPLGMDSTVVVADEVSTA